MLHAQGKNAILNLLSISKGFKYNYKFTSDAENNNVVHFAQSRLDYVAGRAIGVQPL